MISVYGGSGFVGGTFKRMYSDCVEMQRDDRKPKTKEILYFISTTDNYNVHDNITLDVDTNLKVLCEVLDYCRSEDITFNFISSWFVYGKTPYMPAKEDSRCDPTGFYSITKKCAEDLIRSFADTYGMKYRILRLCNVLGAGDTKATRKKNAITWMINELKAGRDIKLYDHGNHCRDIMHVQDVCRAIKLVMDKGNLNEIYNIGSGKPTTVSEIISLANHYIKSSGKIESIDPPEFHNSVQCQNFWMSTKKLQSLGFEQHLDLEFIVKDLCL
jgi:nucleoside-diphosphate-sugar epimerase